MCSLSANMLLPTKLKPAYSDKRSNSLNSLLVSKTRSKRKNQSIAPVRLLLIILLTQELRRHGTYNNNTTRRNQSLDHHKAVQDSPVLS
ncbi:hypothetical protein DY000_02027103 [Brassica cretica]|uniref:Uncharacterized protein n=1 Tax=Brassica cretica TaxID=69181 RepID=A0ABQ7E6I0_BRACR|nr:hypothetical protein DY000_02027103 [Brassica cretica]